MVVVAETVMEIETVAETTTTVTTDDLDVHIDLTTLATVPARLGLITFMEVYQRR